MKQNIELHIEELMLHGFQPGDRHRIGEAIRHELSRLLIQRGMPSLMARPGDHPLLNAGSLKLGANFGAESIGRQVAENLYESFQRTTNHKETR